VESEKISILGGPSWSDLVGAPFRATITFVTNYSTMNHLLRSLRNYCVHEGRTPETKEVFVIFVSKSIPKLLPSLFDIARKYGSFISADGRDREYIYGRKK
jgi:hypothetical protein